MTISQCYAAVKAHNTHTVLSRLLTALDNGTLMLNDRSTDEKLVVSGRHMVLKEHLRTALIIALEEQEASLEYLGVDCEEERE